MTVIDHDLLAVHRGCDTQRDFDGEHLLGTDEPPIEHHPPHVGADPSAVVQGLTEANGTPDDGTFSSTPTIVHSQSTVGPSGWMDLRFTAELFERALNEKIAIANMLTHSDRDAFGHLLDSVQHTEDLAKKALLQCYRRVVPPELREWQERSKGIGPHIAARILGTLGDPYIATPHWWEGSGPNRTLMQGEPYVRTIGQLWQYCGHGAPARRTRGMTADEAMGLGSPRLKTLVWNASVACVKQPSDAYYRKVYDNARLANADKLHTVECVRCGPSGKPAQPGTPWSPGHQHAHAIRMIGKEILRDMWLARHNVKVQS